MSALYLSKVVPQDSTRSLLKPAQGQSSGSGKRVHLTKMSEDSEQSKDDLPPLPSAKHQPGPEDISGVQSMPSQLSKEKLHQQRQKCELRRLLKHTHPELKMLDEVVDEELAEVLSLETAGETGYEGEVLSRCLIFENCALTNKVSPYTPKMHMAEGGKVERGDVGKTSAVYEEHEERPCKGDDKPSGPSHDPNRECEEEMIKIDVQAKRRIFESQSPNPDNKCKGKVSISGDAIGAIQKQFEMCSQDKPHSENKGNPFTKRLDLTDQPNKQGPCVHILGQSFDHDGRKEVSTGESVFEGLPDSEEFEKIIQTSEALFQNNPFIPTNIEREQSFVHTSLSQSPAGDSGEAQDVLMDNVKNRTHLFESMPFDQIRSQNKDDIETQVENIKETLNSLYHVNAIHSDGLIIEVNETMIAKKAKFTLSQSGPKIKYDEVAEGGAQNFILQLLPRSNLKPQITYLKEGGKGNMEATVVNVPVQHHHFSTNQDTEFRTANVAQLVEDILNQDNSLRKGVIIQEDTDGCAEVVVYSLYNYFDEEDLKGYCPPQGTEYDEPEQEQRDESQTDNQELRKGVIESTISCLLETPKEQICQGSIRPEITEKGNVKLFRSCIEKGDLEYLKTLQGEPTEQEQEVTPNQNVAGQGMELHHEQSADQAEESTSEWVPVDVKRLKHMFSGDQRPVQPKQNIWENRAQSTCAFTGQNVPLGKSQSSTEYLHGKVQNSFRESGGKTQEDVCNSAVAPQGSHLTLEKQDDGRVHQAELVEVVDNNEEISNLQTAINSLHQATIEARSLHHSSQANQIQKKGTEPTCDEIPATSNVTSEHKSDRQHVVNTETCHKDNHSEVQTVETCRKMGQKETEVFQKQHLQSDMVSEHSPTTEQQEDEEVDFHGKLQAALDSLERSNINVSRGDFRAAMIYRNVSKPHKERSLNVKTVSVQNPTKEGPMTEPESTQAPLWQEVSKGHVTSANAEPPIQGESKKKTATSGVSEKSRRPVGPKPAIPPKPEHLKVKQGDVQSQKFEVRHQVQGPVVILETDNIDKNIDATAEEKSPKDFPVKENMNETDESHVDFHEACKKFEAKKAVSVKSAPVKPKRVKIAQPDNKKQKQRSDNNSSILAHVVEEPQQTLTGPSCNNPNTCGQSADSKDPNEKEMKQEGKVEMREKKRRTETEDERRQRLSVHMDEIMRENTTAAMDIFDNLRKQEELQSILSRVEEIEQDTSEVDVRCLRGVFENIPDWVVSSGKKKQKKVKVENKEKKTPSTRDTTESKSSMAHVFGDLERASEEIMNLKEQTLARLMDIEQSIKKALYSVSTLKSDSDIAGLSCLFKESLGTEQGSPSSGSISKISIGSSRTKSQVTSTAQGTTALPVSQGAGTEVTSAKQASPPSSPAFISIQSAVRKTDKTELLPPETKICPKCQHSPKTEEKFRTTKTLTCNSPAQTKKRDPRKGSKKQSSCNPKRELSVLEVQTDQEGKSIMSTKTVRKL